MKQPAHRERLCWWCNTQLSTRGHATAKDHDGNEVIVHIACKKPTEREAKMVTAQPKLIEFWGLA